MRISQVFLLLTMLQVGSPVYAISGQAACSNQDGFYVLNQDGAPGGFVSLDATVRLDPLANHVNTRDRIYTHQLVEGHLGFDAAMCGGKLTGDAHVSGHSVIDGNAHIFGSAIVTGFSRVFGNARIGGSALVNGSRIDGGDIVMGSLLGNPLEPLQVPSRPSQLYRSGGVFDFQLLTQALEESFEHPAPTKPLASVKEVSSDVEAVGEENSVLNGTWKCSICMDSDISAEIVKPRRCEHAFHRKCIVRWLRSVRCCPLCRSQTSVETQTDEHDFDE